MLISGGYERTITVRKAKTRANLRIFGEKPLFLHHIVTLGCYSAPMVEQAPIPLREENIPAMLDKHSEKIDSAIGKDSETQQRRLQLFDHDPKTIAAHYPELQKKSQELAERTSALQKSAATAGWVAFAATAVASGYATFKKKAIKSPLIASIFTLFTSITAGFAANYATDRLMGQRIREESNDVAEASRKAYERELAVYMEDTASKLARVSESEKRAAAAMAAPAPAAGKTEGDQSKWTAQVQPAESRISPEALKPVEGHATQVEKSKAVANDPAMAIRA